MDKDTLMVIKIIDGILDILKEHLGHCVGDFTDKDIIQTKRQELSKIIKDKEEQCK